MATVVEPVKLFVAALWADHAALDEAIRLVQQRWGPVDFVGPDRAFDVTDYYGDEMGEGLQRRLVSLEPLVMPDRLPEIKLGCIEIEQQLAAPRGRRVNLDAGYLDHNKIVLASIKYAGQKIYLGRGVYADLVARYRDGRYRPLEWTFPDFRDGRYDDELARLRRTYLEQLRQWRSGR